MRWTRRTIVEEIKRLHKANTELNYASAESNHLNLVRAAAWHFGTWRRAVEAAGIDYNRLSKYQRWDRQRIIERIRQLHKAGADLSWRAVSLEVDPPLAAAALRPNGFPSWRDAITAAGLDISEVARYQYWDDARIIQEIQRLHRKGEPLSSKAVQISNQRLFCAARRRFESWDNALNQAGFSAAAIRLRRPSTHETRQKKLALNPKPAALPHARTRSKQAKNTAALNGTALAKGSNSAKATTASKSGRTPKNPPAPKMTTPSRPSAVGKNGAASRKPALSVKATANPSRSVTPSRGAKNSPTVKPRSTSRAKPRTATLSRTVASRTR